MKTWWLVLAALVASGARADALGDKFNTVWESLWFQGGSPARIERWEGDIRARVHGVDWASNRERVIKGLRVAADAAGIKVVDVSDAPDAAAQANLDVELVAPNDLTDNLACFVRREKVVAAKIVKALMKMRTHIVYHCILHEAMHVMGISGHPSGDTILSYFYQRVDAITEMDRLMLRAWYSPQMTPGMTPLEALVVLTDAVVKAEGANAAAAKAAQQAFLAKTMQSMEAFAGDKGEIPVILKRSGTASSASMTWGKTLMRHYLGWAYIDGTIVAADPTRALPWFERAARDNLSNAQFMLGELLENGKGVTPNALDAYFWYGLAAAQNSASGKTGLERVAFKLTPEQVEAAKAKIAAFKPS